MTPLLLLLLLPLLLCMTSAQIVGPDDAGSWYFFYSNYSAVYMLRSIKPSIEFHPVLGGAEDPYVRLQNWAAFNFTNMEEVSGSTVVDRVNPMDLAWQLTTSNDTDPETGNLHVVGTISATAANGAKISVICETWSLGITKPYGNLTSVVAPDETEVSLQISNWPFRSMRNVFRVTMLVGLDEFAIPSIASTPYQRKVTISSANTTFSATLWTEGIIDGVMTHFTYDRRAAL